MSRCYEVSLDITTKNRKRVEKVLKDWFPDSCPNWNKGVVSIWGASFTQTAGRGDSEYNDYLKNELKKAGVKCSVNIRWTYMEELPYEEYDFKVR